MGNSVCQAPPQHAVHHLLGHPIDLAGHIEAHGPLAVAWAPCIVAGSPHRQPRIVRADGTGRRRVSLRRIKLAMASSAATGNARGQWHGGRTCERQGQGAPDPGSAPGARWRTIPGRYVPGRRIVVCIPAGRDAVAAAVQHAMDERSAARYARVSEIVVRPPDRFVAGEESALVSWVDRSVRCRCSGRTRARPCVSGSDRPWCTTPRRWRTSPSSPATAPSAFLARGMAEEPGTCLVTVGGAVAQPGVVEVDRGTASPGDRRAWDPVEPPQAFLVGGYGGTWVRTRALRYALRLPIAAHHRCLRRRRRDRRPRGTLVRGGRSARIARYLAGQSCRAVRAMCLRASGHRRRPCSPRPGQGSRASCTAWSADSAR